MADKRKKYLSAVVSNFWTHEPRPHSYGSISTVFNQELHHTTEIHTFNTNISIIILNSMRAIRKVTSDELLIKQAMRKKNYIQEIRIYLSYFST